MSAFPFALGIYEKALPASASWKEKFLLARRAGYDFIELSIDESDWRLARLDWKRKKRLILKSAAENAGLELKSMCLSAQRRFPLGSQESTIRAKSVEILKKAIDLAVDTGIEFILIPGYDVFYEESTPETRENFIVGLQLAASLAEESGILLALENTDKYVTSIELARGIVDEIKSSWFKLYGDIGNLVAFGYDLQHELTIGSDRLAGIHIKDALPGVMRDVPLGEGVVPFEEMFRVLHAIDFSGPLMLEIWEDPGQDPLNRLTTSRQWIENKYQLSLKVDQGLKDPG